MKRIRTFFFFIGVITSCLVVLFVCLFFARNTILKFTVIKTTENIIGTSVKIERIALDLVNQEFKVEGFKLMQPKDYGEGVMIDIPSINANYDMNHLLRKKVFLKQLSIDLKELVVIKDTDGKLNVDSLKIAKKNGGECVSETSSAEMEKLCLSVGKVVYKDYKKGPKPEITVYDINVKNKEYKDIPSERDLAVLVITQSMLHTAIKDAAIYGVTAATGLVGYIPAKLGLTSIDNGGTQAIFNNSFEGVYNAAQEALEQIGTITGIEEINIGPIKGTVNSSEIIIKLAKENEESTKVSVSAKKVLLPKPKISKAIIYLISERLQNKEPEKKEATNDTRRNGENTL